MEKKENYLAPLIEEIEMMSREKICAASTEGYGTGDHSYGEDDWD